MCVEKKTIYTVKHKIFEKSLNYHEIYKYTNLKTAKVTISPLHDLLEIQVHSLMVVPKTVTFMDDGDGRDEF